MLDSEQEPFSWGFEAGFLRSPVNPRMLLLNRTPEIDCADDGNATGNASAWNLVSVANDLLRVDLSSLFNEIGGHFRERAKLRFYIDLQNAIRQPPAPHDAQHASMDYAAEPDHDDWLDPDDSDQESAQAELNEAEIEVNLQKQKERDLDFFAPIFDKAITRHAHGEISGMARYLLENVCRQCVMNITAIPDYRYYSCWMNNNAIECNEINRLYRAVITTSAQLNKQEMASLFSSYLKLVSNDMDITTTNGKTGLTEPVPYKRDNPRDNYPKVNSQIETACVCTNTDLFRALLIVFYQECLELAPLLKNTEAPSLLAQNEEFFPAAIKTSDPRQFRLFDNQLPAIIRFGDAFAYAAKKHLPGNETAQKLEEHLSDIKRMNSAPFMQAFRKNYLEAMRENQIYANGDFHTYAELNDQENLNRLVRLQAVIAKAGELYFTEEECSFASLYARILHELLLCEVMLVLIRKLDKKDWLWQLGGKANFPVICLLVLGMWGSAYILNTPVIEVYRNGFYLFCFLAGYILFSHEQIQSLLAKWAPCMLAVSGVLAVVYTVHFWGQNYAALSNLKAPLTNLYAWFACLGVLGAGKRWLDKETAFTRCMASRSFGIYVLHNPLLVLLAWAMDKLLHFPVWSMYLLLPVLLALLLPPLIALIKRIPVLRTLILGEK